MVVTAPRRLFTVDDYGRMRETGILSEDDRVELLDGEIYLMSPIGPLHVAIVNRLNKLLSRSVGNEGIVSVQNPIRLDNYGEPQPDIAVLCPRADDYAQSLPMPDDVLLLIEVADSSLAYDRDEKLPRYASAAIGEVWIVDIGAQAVEQYTHPLQGEYTRLHKVLFGNELVATQISTIRLTTDQIFA